MGQLGDRFQTYRRKPTTIKAAQWVVTHTPSDDAAPIVDFINNNNGQAYFLYDFNEQQMSHHPVICIETNQGWSKADPSDYICWGIGGEFWPVKPHVFNETNELVVDHEERD